MNANARSFEPLNLGPEMAEDPTSYSRPAPIDDHSEISLSPNQGSVSPSAYAPYVPPTQFHNNVNNIQNFSASSIAQTNSANNSGLWIPTDPFSEIFFPSQSALLSQLLSSNTVLNTHLLTEMERYKKEIDIKNKIIASRDVKLGNYTRFISENKRHMRIKSQRIALLESQVEESRTTLELSQEIARFRCNVCAGRLVETLLGCKHTLCNPCINRLLTGNEAPNCPFCREEITQETVIQISF